VVLSQSGKKPETTLSPIHLYDELISQYPESYEFPDSLNERDPAVICYTSATTGKPKGVVYSHRNIVMHTYGIVATLSVMESDTALHIVPMFHVNGWGAPFGALAMGCKQVLPGRDILNMQKLCHIIAEEKITFTGGVPTIWMMLYDYLEKDGWYDFSSLKTIFSGGAACPLSLMKGLNEKYGFPIRQAYGMTETSPMALVSATKSYMSDWPMEKIYDIRSSAGMPALGVEMKIVTDQGNEVRMDGREWGEIYLRGPWIAREYFKDPENTDNSFIDGWLHTGDIATMDEEGYVKLVDRKKDLIKSGGEWISSVDIENSLMTCPKIMEAAVIGIPDAKWQERPLACIALYPGETITMNEIKEYLKDKITPWWIPEQFISMNQIPKTSVGKFNKRELRQLFSEGRIVPVSDNSGQRG
jgi:fatty-acyl-CoA synthase